MIGNFGDVAGFSIYLGKSFGALGDASVVMTNSKAIAEKVRALGKYGSDYKYHHIYQGNNSKLDELQATFLSAKLPHLNRINEERRIVKYYLEGINNPEIILPFVLDYAELVWSVFAVRTKNHDGLAVYLADKGISCKK